MSDKQYQHYSTVPPPPSIYGERQDQANCFWKVLFAILLTAALTFGLTAGAAYMLYLRSEALTSSMVPEKNVSISTTVQPIPGLTFEQNDETEQALEKLAEVLNLLKKNYYHELSDAQLIERMTEGLANNMDSQYTFYLTKERNEEVEAALLGEYGGIGAVVEERETTRFMIVDLIEEAPAMESGLLLGDLITGVDGVPATDFVDVSHLASKIKGEPGTIVTLTIFRSSTNESFEIELTRRLIRNASVRHHMLTDQLGYVRISEFSGHVNQNFRAAVADLVQAGAQHLVFDLRNNSGGYADECVSMVDYLVDKGVVASIVGRRNGREYREEWKSDARTGVPEDMQFVILLNEYSASASELFAGALRDRGRAILVGEQSFGKGVGTLTYSLDDGSAIQITNFEYFLPGGESIEGVGLTPDIEVLLPEEAEGLTPSMMTPEQDTQLAKAVEILEALLAP